MSTIFTTHPGRGYAKNFLPWSVSLVLYTLTSPTMGGQPMVTDDAGIAAPQTCQLGAWVIKTHDTAGEYWLMPACNPTGNLEISAGFATMRENSQNRTTHQVIQLKTLFKPLETNGWGIGFSTGTTRHPQLHTRDREWYATVPLSFSFQDDQFLLHTNLGWLRHSETEAHRLTWGIGTETRLNDKAEFIAETFGQNQGNPYYQLGMRYWLIPDRVQIDATYGDCFSRQQTEARWISLGVQFFPTPFL